MAAGSGSWGYGAKATKTGEEARAAEAVLAAAGGVWDHLPEGVKEAVKEVLRLPYRELVAEAPSELERSAGMTLVHRVRLEICARTHLAAECKRTELLMQIRLVRWALRR